MDLGGGATSRHQGSWEDLTAHTRLLSVEQEGGGLSTEQPHTLTRGGCPCSHPVENLSDPHQYQKLWLAASLLGCTVAPINTCWQID